MGAATATVMGLEHTTSKIGFVSASMLPTSELRPLVLDVESAMGTEMVAVKAQVVVVRLQDMMTGVAIRFILDNSQDFR